LAEPTEPADSDAATGGEPAEPERAEPEPAEPEPPPRHRKRVTTEPPPGTDPTPSSEPPRHALDENDQRLREDKPPHY
jgi:hypothetical protein